jgi:GDP-L-fucose synthase
MNKNSLIYVAGHNGLVGSSLVRTLNSKGYDNILTATKKELNLINQEDTFNFLSKNKPEYVFLAAAKVGGILKNNKYPAEFIYENIQIQNNIIHGSYVHGVKKLLFLGSSCIYPKFCNQPITEDQLLSGYLEPTNEAYAIAKIAGLKMCSYYKKQFGVNFISCMPTNLYGINDNFDEQGGHVIPGMISKFCNAVLEKRKTVECFGTGSPKREFLYVDDLSEACVFLMQNYEDENTINVGTGSDITIKELAELIAAKTGFEGDIVWDSSKPDGTPRKVLDVKKIEELGWSPSISLEDGIGRAISWFKTTRNLV